MWDLFKEIASKLDSTHLFILVPLVALTYLVFVLIKMIEKKDSQFHESFMEKEKQMLAFAEKTFEHTLTITRMVDVLNVLVGKLK